MAFLNKNGVTCTDRQNLACFGTLGCGADDISDLKDESAAGLKLAQHVVDRPTGGEWCLMIKIGVRTLKLALATTSVPTSYLGAAL